MHIITRRRLLEAARIHPRARSSIDHWYNIALHAHWTNLSDTRKAFPHADQVRVASGRTVTVFNLSDAYRLITAIHYNRNRLFVLKFLTHAEYDRAKWKDQL